MIKDYLFVCSVEAIPVCFSADLFFIFFDEYCESQLCLTELS